MKAPQDPSHTHPTENLSPGRLLGWMKKGGLTVLDQGLFSAANFLVNILLARWLPPEEYGAFAVALSIFYLAAGIHTAVLTEPMMVFGAGKYRPHFQRYLGILLWGHWAISAVIALGLGGAAWFFLQRGSPLRDVLLGLAAASPFLLLLWLTRRACYANLRPDWAVGGSAVNLIAVLAGLSLLWRARLLSTLNGLVLLGAAAGTASLVLAALHLRPRVWGSSEPPTPRTVVADHRSYGGWNLLAVGAYWASGQILIVLVPLFVGLAASAVVAAIWNLFRPVRLFMESLSSVVLPAFSTWVNQDVPALELKRRATKLMFLFGAVVAAYGLIVSMAAQPILHVLYDGKYDTQSEWVLWTAIVWTLAAGMIGGQAFLRSMGQTKSVFYIWSIATLFAVFVGIPLMAIFELRGAFLAFLTSYALGFAVTYKSVRSQ